MVMGKVLGLTLLYWTEIASFVVWFSQDSCQYIFVEEMIMHIKVNE